MFKKILLPIDISNAQSYEMPLEKALTLAQTFNSELVLVTIIDVDLTSGWLQGGESKKIIDDFSRKTEKQFNAFCDKHIPEEIVLTKVVKIGKVYKEIIHTIDSIKPDLVVMGAHRQNLKEYLLGVNAARVVRHSKCSTLVLRHS